MDFQSCSSTERAPGGSRELRGGSIWRVASRWFRGWVALGAAGLLVTGGAAARGAPARPPGAEEFMPYVQLAPFVVKGNQLAISIHARSKRDRRYAEEFAEEVVKVVYEGVTESTGKGLVIIGKKGEPHPVGFFRQFLALAEAGKLDPAVAARGPELFALLDHWKHTASEGKASGAGETADVDLDFEKIITALPLPLEGVGAKLYQLAWAEGFDEAKVEARLRALRPEDLEGNLFARFDWVFYLPPRGVFDRVLDGIIADALKEEEMGFLARTAVKGALLIAKPIIRRAIEGMRRSLMLATVVRARTSLDEAEVFALMGAYLEVALPGQRAEPGTEHERAVKAVRAQLAAGAAKARQAPTPVEEPDAGSSGP